MINFPIDYVIPYVNNKKPIWRQNYINFCRQNNRLDILPRIDTERYDDFDLLIYLFRGIYKFTPWVRKIYLIVQDITQVPEWISLYPKTNIVLHQDIIPSEFLPTYNSCTIEMFLHNIPDLEEHFIYANDDMFFINNLKQEDFFTEDGLPKLDLKITPLLPPKSMFDNVCQKCWELASSSQNKKLIYSNQYICPGHGVTPLLKSQMQECYSKLRPLIHNSISALRTNFNYNQYLFADYIVCKNICKNSNRKNQYLNLTTPLNEIINNIVNKQFQIIILNDNGSVDRDYIHKNINKIKEAFESIGLDKE